MKLGQISSVALLSLLCSCPILSGCGGETGTTVAPPPTGEPPLGGEGTVIVPGQEDEFKKAMDKHNN